MGGGRSDLDSLDQHDLLIIIAEVGAAFMGFSMVVGLLRADSPSGRARFLMVRDVAEISLITVVAALVPLVLQSYGLRHEWIWRFSSLAVSLAWVTGLLIAVRRVGLANPAAPWRQNLLSAIAGPIVNIGGNALLWYNALAPAEPSASLYVSALVLLLLLAGSMFVQATFYQGPSA